MDAKNVKDLMIIKFRFLDFLCNALLFIFLLNTDTYSSIDLIVISCMTKCELK